jgi:hypothetical protein
MQRAIFQPDETIRVGEAAEFHAKLRQSRPRLQFPEDARVDFLRRLEEQGTLQAQPHAFSGYREAYPRVAKFAWEPPIARF